MYDTGNSLPILLALMAALAGLETALPLQPARNGTRRAANLGLTAAYFGLNFALLAGAAALAAVTQPRALLSLSALPPVAALLLGLALLDFFTYAAHVLMHKLPWLWRLHRVHHSDLLVDVTTTFRQHPLEGLVRFAFTYGPAIALGATPLAIASYRLLSGVNALFEHANIRVPAALDRALRPVWVTPDFHKVHHSRAQPETDTNYGNLLSVYDRLFGTLARDKPAAQVRYGLDTVPNELAFGALLQLPFAGGPRA